MSPRFLHGLCWAVLFLGRLFKVRSMGYFGPTNTAPNDHIDSGRSQYSPPTEKMAVSASRYSNVDLGELNTGNPLYG